MSGQAMKAHRFTEGGQPSPTADWLARRARGSYHCPMADPPHASPPSSLPRQLGLWSAVAIVIGTTIGSGIFRTPASVANRLPGPLPIAAIWVTGGLLALCGALTLAEVAGAFPATGGIDRKSTRL